MNESCFKDILAEICEEEKAELNKFPPFKASLRHRFAMKRIFRMFEKKTQVTASDTPTALTSQSKRLHLSKRLIIIFIVIICAIIFTGFVGIYFSKNFYGMVYNNRTHLFAVNTENCPATIAYEYCLPELPEGYVLDEQGSLLLNVYTLHEYYVNESSGQVIVLTQYTKNRFKSSYNTRHHELEEVEINGHSGLLVDYSNDEANYSIVVWDNGDYVLELSGDFNKSDLLNLAKSAKVL